MKMTPAILIVGGLLVFWCSVYVAVVLPAYQYKDAKESQIWRKWTPAEADGHQLYNDNGCSYCHSQFVRKTDWDLGAERYAQSGDYYQMQPAILGTERTGPDL